MRTTRLLAALLGLALLGLAPIAPPASAAAPATTSAEAATALPASAPASRARLPRELNDRSVKRGGSWFIRGRVTPEGGRTVVLIKRKPAAKATWRTWKRIRADRKGRFMVKVVFPEGTRGTFYYSAAVKRTAKYQQAHADRVYTACRRPRC